MSGARMRRHAAGMIGRGAAGCAALAALLLAAGPLAAQRGGAATLLVEVRDSSGQPVAGARVAVAGRYGSRFTGSDGEAKVTGIDAGNRLIEITRNGFAQLRIAADFTPGDTVRREVRLTAAPIELEGITATSWGRNTTLVRNGFYDRQRRGFGSFMTSQQIEDIRPARNLELLRYMRGVMVTHDRKGNPMVISTRGQGLGNCLPQVWVDGMQMVMHDIRDQVDALEMVPPDDIAGIEVFAGAATIPAEYNRTGTACGVILIWSRH